MGFGFRTVPFVFYGVIYSATANYWDSNFLLKFRQMQTLFIPSHLLVLYPLINLVKIY